MGNIVVQLRITMESPLSIGAGGSTGTLADKSIVRDGWNRPIIPGSQLKGNVRANAEALARTLGRHVAAPTSPDPSCVIQPIFGGPHMRRSPLFFNDLLLVEQPIDPGNDAADEQVVPDAENTSGQRTGYLRPGVTINRRRGTAEDKRLYIQETTASGVVFHAERAIVGTLDHRRDLALLVAALRLTTRWGGAKSRGQGWAKVQAQTLWDGAVFDDEMLATALREWQVSA